MSRVRTARARPPIVAALAATVLLSFASAQGPSDPVATLPALPAVEGIAVFVSDLEAAPPPAQGPIVQLTYLGAYPLTPAMEALPNEPLDAPTAAYMLVNLFAADRAEQFPVPADVALGTLSDVGVALPADAVLTGGGLRDAIAALLGLPSEREAALLTTLNERYPALAAGNAAVPLTRAGAALMMTIALEHLTTSAPVGTAAPAAPASTAPDAPAP